MIITVIFKISNIGQAFENNFFLHPITITQDVNSSIDQSLSYHDCD